MVKKKVIDEDEIPELFKLESHIKIQLVCKVVSWGKTPESSILAIDSYVYYYVFL